jgi:hypothetical protein
MYLKYSDIRQMFSMYAVVPTTNRGLRDKIKENIQRKKETMVYEVRINPATGKKKLARRPK